MMSSRGRASRDRAHAKPLVAAILALIAAAPVPAAAAEWELAWADEFDTDGPPDASRWVPETGFIRNDELQFYTAGRLENARIENGHLVIEGRKERVPNPAYDPSAKQQQRRFTQPFADYTSASLTTQGKASFLYGRIETRAKLPEGRGVWPAIWLLGVNRPQVKWPKCGEIDVMEFVGKEPDRVHATVHFWKEGRHASQGGRLETPRPSGDFHRYAVEWFPDRMEFFFDDRPYFSFRIDDAGTGPDNPFRRPHYLLLNLALGGTWGGPVDDDALPQRFRVDYVRVYRERK